MRQDCLSHNHFIKHLLYFRHLQICSMLEVNRREIQRRRQPSPCLSPIVYHHITSPFFYWIWKFCSRSWWKPLVKSIDNAHYLMQVCHILTQIEFLHLQWIILCDTYFIIDHILRHLEYRTCHCPKKVLRVSSNDACLMMSLLLLLFKIVDIHIR
jgi:hypothetical protein